MLITDGLELFFPFRKVMTLYFACIASQKSLTTWLFRNILEHPELYFPPNTNLISRKELNLFLSARGPNYPKVVLGDNLTKFKCGDMSPQYLTRPECMEKIYNHNPNMKIIVMFKHPIARALSQFLMERSFNIPSFEVLKTMSFYDAYINDYPQAPQISMAERNRYATHLAAWMERFPREQIHVIVSEDITTHPREVLQGVFKFLDIQEIYNEKFVNAIVRPLNIGSPPDRRQFITDEEYNDLLARTNDEVTRLEELIGRDLSFYKKNHFDNKYVPPS